MNYSEWVGPGVSEVNHFWSEKLIGELNQIMLKYLELSKQYKFDSTQVLLNGAANLLSCTALNTETPFGCLSELTNVAKTCIEMNLRVREKKKNEA